MDGTSRKGLGFSGNSQITGKGEELRIQKTQTLTTGPVLREFQTGPVLWFLVVYLLLLAHYFHVVCTLF